MRRDQTWRGCEAGSQLRFPGAAFARVKPRAPRRRRATVRVRKSNSLEAVYESRLAAARGRRSVETYRWLRREVQALASTRAGREVGIVELFRRPDLLGQALATDRRGSGTGRASKSTIAHRRTAMRSVAILLRPELRAQISRKPLDVIDEALRAVAERVGCGYRIAGGTPRTRGGPTPTPDEVQGILAALGATPGWAGLRDGAFFRLLGTTAARVNALRSLDGRDCVRLPDGRTRLLLHQKNGREPHEAELNLQAAAALQRYLAAHNQWATATGLAAPIVLGAPGPVWRSPRGRMWTGRAVRQALRRACAAAGVPDYTPHAFRRFCATQAAERLPRWQAAVAGGWRGTERFDAHYVRPREEALWRKLAAGPAPTAARAQPGDVRGPPPAVSA